MSTKKLLLSGNEAVAQGAWEAGVHVGCGYPGTPSTEILESLSRYSEVKCEWSVNEKVALEVAIGASFAGARSMVTMKHVGVNVAADPLFTASYTGVEGGLVVVTADEPNMYSSQNEQDNRHFAIAAKLPMFEPSDSSEALAFTRYAFEMSENFDTPVFLRTVTRLSHSKSPVTTGDRIDRPIKGFTSKPAKHVMIPANARVRRQDVEHRMLKLSAAAETHPANRIEKGCGKIGVITSGISYTYVKEVLPDADILKLGLVYPLPRRMIEDFAKSVKTLYVIEELDPFIETQIKSWGLSVIGKEIFPATGEFSPDILRKSLNIESASLSKRSQISFLEVPERRPRLCPGCPHGHVFSVLKEKGLIVAGDIGCYTLGTLPPYEVIDTCLDMGASITMAQGIGLVNAENNSSVKVAAVIGDSTFAHSGITGLLNACWNKRDGLFVVLDNGTTAMTGMQPNPASGERLGREDAPKLDYCYLSKAFNIPADNFAVVDAYNKSAITETLDTMIEKSGVRLLVIMGLCVIEMQKLKKLGKLEQKKTVRRNLSTDEIKCAGGGNVE